MDQNLIWNSTSKNFLHDNKKAKYVGRVEKIVEKTFRNLSWKFEKSFDSTDVSFVTCKMRQTAIDDF